MRRSSSAARNDGAEPAAVVVEPPDDVGPVLLGQELEERPGRVARLRAARRVDAVQRVLRERLRDVRQPPQLAPVEGHGGPRRAAFGQDRPRGPVDRDLQQVEDLVGDRGDVGRRGRRHGDEARRLVVARVDADEARLEPLVRLEHVDVGMPVAVGDGGRELEPALLVPQRALGVVRELPGGGARDRVRVARLGREVDDEVRRRHTARSGWTGRRSGCARPRARPRPAATGPPPPRRPLLDERGTPGTPYGIGRIGEALLTATGRARGAT